MSYGEIAMVIPMVIPMVITIVLKRDRDKLSE